MGDSPWRGAAVAYTAWARRAAAQIVDLYHAREYVHDLGKLLTFMAPAGRYESGSAVSTATAAWYKPIRPSRTAGS